jgi:site-specific DNA recombinase
MASSRKIGFALIRVSTSEQSTNSQILALKRAAENFGYVIPDDCVFQEKISGFDDYNADRKSIIDLKSRILQNPPSAIFCWELSRLTRNSMKVGRYIQELSLDNNIPMYFLDYDIWTIINGQENRDGIQQLIGAAVAVEKERTSIKERTSRGRRLKAEEEYYVGHLSDGYIVEEDRDNGEKKIEVDTERAQIISEIFTLYLEGKSTNYIAAYLNSQHIPTTNAYRLLHPSKFKGYKSTYTPKGNKVAIERNNSQWDGSAIAHILSNEWYVGRRYYKGIVEKDEEGNPKLKPLTHKPIITEDIWKQVQSMIGGKVIAHSRKPIKNRALLSGLIYCGKCGSKMYSHVTGLNNHYYCSSYDRGAKCGLRGVCKENIEACIYGLLKYHCYDETINGRGNPLTNFYKMDNATKQRFIKDIENNGRIISEFNQQIEICQTRIKNLVELQADNFSNKELVKIYADQIIAEQAQIKSLENQIYQYEGRNRRIEANLRAEKDIKTILHKILHEVNLDIIEQLFHVGIERVEVFNADVNSNVIRVHYTNGKQDEFIYSHRLMKTGYILLNIGVEMPVLHYDEINNVIHADEYPIYINSKQADITKIYIVPQEHSTSERGAWEYLKRENLPIPEEDINGVPSQMLFNESNRGFRFDEDFTVDTFVRLFRHTDREWYYERLEGLSELALEQQAKYKEWRKKYNTGKPTQVPWVLRDADYNAICAERKKLYNRIYKIKNRTNLSEEEKLLLIEPLKERLDVLAAQVKHIPKD